MFIKRSLVILFVVILAAVSMTPQVSFAQQASPDAIDPASIPTAGNIVDSPCASNTPHSGTYTVNLCITSPKAGANLTGSTTVSVSIHVTGKNPGIQNIIYFMNSEYLIVTYQSPYSIVLPTAQWQNGTYTISVEAIMLDGYTTVNQPSLPVTFSNSSLSSPLNSESLAPFSNTAPQSNPAPLGSFTVVAVGDGADGSAHETSVTNLIASINPSLFLYLGDVYFSGTPTEFINNYGSGSNFYSQFRAVTEPTVGNHEYLTTNAAGYFGYWNNIPPYYSYNADGWHFISINSNNSKVGGSGTNSPQYLWLKADLAANSNLCTIAYYHHPLFNIGPEGPATGMTNIWGLLAQNGVSLVLNGHDHDYQRWKALDANGNPNPNGVTEIIVGTGGHGIQAISGSDSRVVFKDDVSPQAYGVVEVSLASNGATFSYVNYAGVTLDSGFAPCNKAGGDTQPPSVPSGLTGTAASPTQVNLTWQASTDNTGVTGYTIYRNGTKLGTVSGTTLSFSDTTASPSTTYSYTVDAFDAAGNHSAQSSPVSVTTPSSSDTQPPSVPAGLTANAVSSAEVDLGWQASTDNVGVTGYTIYRGGTQLAIVSGSTLTYADKTVSPSTTYSYTVDAFDAAGNHSAQSTAATATTPAQSTNLTFAVGADSYVNSGSPTSNFGTATKWYTDGSPVVHGLLKFSVSGLNGLIPQHAYLHVYANSGSSAGISIYSIVDNTWAETTVNWNTAPAFGSLLGSTGAITAGSWLTIDVTAFVTGEGTFSFGASTPGATNISFAARESGVNAAYLVVALP